MTDIDSVITSLARNWWVLVVRGVAAIIFGALTFVMPQASLTALVLLFGGYALVDGVFSLVGALRPTDSTRPWWALLLHGIAGIAAGVVTFLYPGLTAVVLVYVIAAWALITGVLLAPGAPAQPLNLVFTNPYNNSGGINILGVTVTVQRGTLKSNGDPNPDCDGPENLTVTDGSPTPWPLNVPRRSTKSLDELDVDEARWPQVQMLNLPKNQDACKGTTFTFTYTGTATNS